MTSDEVTRFVKLFRVCLSVWESIHGSPADPDDELLAHCMHMFTKRRKAPEKKKTSASESVERLCKQWKGTRVPSSGTKSKANVENWLRSEGVRRGKSKTEWFEYLQEVVWPGIVAYNKAVEENRTELSYHLLTFLESNAFLKNWEALKPPKQERYVKIDDHEDQ